MGCKHGKGYTRCWMRRNYGTKAFNRDGTLKLEYLRTAKRKILANPRHSKYTIAAITEAINFRS